LESSKQELIIQINQYVIDIDLYTVQINVLLQTEINLNLQITTLTTEKSDLQIQITQQAADIEGLTTQIETINATVTSLEAHVAFLETGG
jgi:cell division protein FtsB